MSPSPRSAPGAARALWFALRRARTRGGPKTSDLMKALPRLVAATASGRYTGCSKGKLLLMVAAAGYVVSPVDLLPEGVLGPLGLADDAAVLAWLAGALLSEGQAFLDWERGQQAGAAGAAGRASAGPAPAAPGFAGWASRIPWGAAGRGRSGTTGRGGPGGSAREDRRDGRDGPDVVKGDVIS